MEGRGILLHGGEETGRDSNFTERPEWDGRGSEKNGRDMRSKNVREEKEWLGRVTHSCTILQRAETTWRCRVLLLPKKSPTHRDARCESVLEAFS